jgi:hypothetical protein
MVILGFGLVSLLTLVDRANGTTSSTLQREAATNLSREIVERAHGVPYDALMPGTAAEALRAAADPAGARGTVATGAGAWELRSERRGTSTPATSRDLAVTVSACSVLAPSSRPRVIDPAITLCDSGSGGGSGSTTRTVSSGSCQAEVTDDPVIGVTIKLLVSVDLCIGGALSGLVCTLLGPMDPLASVLGPLIGTDGAVNVLLGPLGGSFTADLCGGKPVIPVSSGTDPSDSARQVTVTVTWGTGTGQAVEQTTIVPRPA